MILWHSMVLWLQYNVEYEGMTSYWIACVCCTCHRMRNSNLHFIFFAKFSSIHPTTLWLRDALVEPFIHSIRYQQHQQYANLSAKWFVFRHFFHLIWDLTISLAKAKQNTKRKQKRQNENKQRRNESEKKKPKSWECWMICGFDEHTHTHNCDMFQCFNRIYAVVVVLFCYFSVRTISFFFCLCGRASVTDEHCIDTRPSFK